MPDLQSNTCMQGKHAQVVSLSLRFCEMGMIVMGNRMYITTVPSMVKLSTSVVNVFLFVCFFNLPETFQATCGIVTRSK